MVPESFQALLFLLCGVSPFFPKQLPLLYQFEDFRLSPFLLLRGVLSLWHACTCVLVYVCACLLAPVKLRNADSRGKRKKESTATSNGKLKISLHEYFLYKQFEIYLPNRKYMCIWWEAAINFRPCLCLSLYVSHLMNWHFTQGVPHILLEDRIAGIDRSARVSNLLSSVTYFYTMKVPESYSCSHIYSHS